MDSILIIFVVFLVISNAFLMWRLFFKKSKTTPEEDRGFLMLQSQLNDLNKTLDSKMNESSKLMSESVKTQFGESQKLIKDITEKMTEIKETNKQVFSMTEQLQNLEKVLKNQKQRGNLGEASLELILSNVLPPSVYKMQYQFKDGDIVDAIIKAKEGIIPIDAKFSLDNYNRIINETDENRKLELEKEFKNDLKKRIDETAKYIKPSEGTLSFAIMFIPAEGIYYDLLINEIGAIKVNARSLIDYAYKDKKVIIVSPTTFLAYLGTILEGFKAFQVEKSVVEIIKKISQLERHIKAYDQYHVKLGTSIATTVNHFNASRKELKKIDKDVFKITGKEIGIEQVVIDKPDKEE